MMDWNDFEARASRVKPEREMKPKRCWLGVLFHEKTPGDDLEEVDFIWMIGHNKIPLRKIRDTYQEKREVTNIQLKYKGTVVDLDDCVKSFSTPNYDPIFFHVDLVESTPPRTSLAVGIESGRENVPQESSHPFDPAGVFNRELSPEMDSQDGAIPTDQNIREVIAQSSPGILESGVAQSMKVLEGLKHTFLQYGSNKEAQAWIQAIEKLIPQAARKRTVVGVVGNTGAGKSSVINAMLDEERLVPTNCMRACTAVVTEMSWNDSNDPSSKYRGEIEFISRADWEKELSVLMKEFLSENGTLSREASNQDSDAGIAWAKFHAVYPKIARDALEDCTIDSLMSEKAVLDVLGTNKNIHTAQPGRFYQELQQYVDSKEKVTKKDKNNDKEKKKKSFQMEYWPLIKVVKIYIKSPALATGAVIVDLPGVHDSNAARAAVAQGYMKQCTGLWIVAPINRAVDDKAAKTLLGESFKRQLKYDGGFSSVTFICSKTDDISITEAIDSLELNDEVADLEEEERMHKKSIKDIENKIADLKESQDVYKVAGAEADKDIEAWEDLSTELDDGKTVFPPLPKSNKRKKSGSSKKSRKKRQVSDDESDNDFVVSDDDTSDESDDDEEDDDQDIQAPREPLTESDIKEKLKKLRETKKNARRESLQIRKTIDDLKPQIREIQEKIVDLKAKISHKCIAGRNEYSKTAIQRDFAAGIKELDQENAAEEDEDNFNPDEDKRDYEEVGKSLPVFCVSSRAYQQMCGRLRKDDSVPGFLTPEETEMPQLQAHCKKLTEAGRVQTCRTFLLNLCQLLTTFKLWASNDGSGANMSDDDKRKQVKYLDRKLKQLDTGLEEAIAACVDEMRREMKHQIFDKYPELIEEAMQVAPETAERWGAHKDLGGLHYMSYKATVRRDGVYQSRSAGHRDFNAELIDPIIKRLATGWERAFQHRLPKAFATYITNSGKILHKFHEAVEERARQNGVGLANLSILKTQIYTYEQLFKDLGTVLITQMTELQREANRDFTPTIGNSMHTAYQLCTDERGAGSYKRMKEHMSTHVEQERHQMFRKATTTVEKHLDQMCKTLEGSMEARADEIFMQMHGDYMQVLGGVQRSEGTGMTKDERELRSAVMALLRNVDAQFEPIAKGEIEMQDATNVDAETQVEEPTTEDENDGVFEDAHESVRDGAEDAVMDVNDETSIAGSSRTRRPGVDVDPDNTGDKENGGLLTPSSDNGMDDEL
ncbi:hypothetical protein P153DRAFT_423306 [Dothidotthia symphoricarpi CBS 119687]|uniref:Tat pathway signal sequence n=1 Tax=Dothidotthia symphoricarpi CBS 119687 TaxID=1392245 RepID=A0A6A6AD26_9PLEO|nr:uncharacterized protein P153DRAFT_423306 [Dothidotthia symphoricarpi CBS 119687]KAF2128828.1 hypothetical protein P153DRAFT_423306 [Dothidotthia symphoricarpi CBS 119687]